MGSILHTCTVLTGAPCPPAVTPAYHQQSRAWWMQQWSPSRLWASVCSASTQTFSPCADCFRVVSDGHRTTSLLVSATESLYGEMSLQAHDQPTEISRHTFPGGSSIFLPLVTDSWFTPKLTSLLAFYSAFGWAMDLMFPPHMRTAPLLKTLVWVKILFFPSSSGSRLYKLIACMLFYKGKVLCYTPCNLLRET